MKALINFLLVSLASVSSVAAQTISAAIPKEVQKDARYVFYLHGAIVQFQGVDAVSPRWGRYEYTAILDTLRSHGFNVISEARPKDTDARQYAGKVTEQIRSLLEAGVPPENIVVVGASMGAGITLDIATRVKNPEVKYAVLGICREGSWPAALKHDSKEERVLCGNFLSIYETSDRFGSCENYFKDQPCVSGFREIRLNLNNGHGFLYKPYREWVEPLVKWINGG